MIYVDSSAIAKLILTEPESAALREYVAVGTLASSAILRTELPRAVARREPAKLVEAMQLLHRVALLSADDAVLDSAARLGPPSLRSLDAIHLASALELRDELTAFVAYDERLLDAASALGLPVASPGLERT